MKRPRIGRRQFIENIARSGAVMSALPKDVPGMNRVSGPTTYDIGERAPAQQSARPKIKFAVIGVNHAHINSMVDAVLRGGGELVSIHAQEPDLAAAFTRRYPQAALARTENEIVENPAIQLVLSAAIPDQRAPIGLRVMQHGKDYMSDKPGITTLEQLAEVRRVQAETIAALLPEVRDVRRFGAAALDLAWCAAGRFDAYYERGVHRWDVAAGGLLCECAGLVVEPLAAAPPQGAGLLASAPEIADALRERVGT
jgi:hypothetical protein